MTLDGQQRVVKSLEPAQALELLLLNLACLPDLLPLDALRAPGRSGGNTTGGGMGSTTGVGAGSGSVPPSRPQSGMSPSVTPVPSQTSAPAPEHSVPPTAAPMTAAPMTAAPMTAPVSAALAQEPVSTFATAAPVVAPAAAPQQTSAVSSSVEQSVPSIAPVEPASPVQSITQPAIQPPVPSSPSAPAGASTLSAGPRTWEGFLDFVATRNGNGMVTGLTRAQGELCGSELVIQCINETHSGMMNYGDSYVRLTRHVSDYFGPDVTVAFTCQEREPVKTVTQLEREVQEHPAVQRVCQAFDVKAPPLVHPRGQN